MDSFPQQIEKDGRLSEEDLRRLSIQWYALHFWQKISMSPKMGGSTS